MSTYEAMMIEREVARGKCQKEREPRNMLCIGELHTVTGKRWTWDIAIICVLLCREKWDSCLIPHAYNFRLTKLEWPFSREEMFLGAGWVAQLVALVSHASKGRGFYSPSGCVQEAILTSICVSLSSPLPLPPPFSKINKPILRWGLKKKKKESFLGHQCFKVGFFNFF